MEPLTLLLIMVVLALALAWAGHLIAKYTWPARRRLWRRRAQLVEDEAREFGTEYDLEKPEAGVVGDNTNPLAGKAVVYDGQAGEIEVIAERERTADKSAETQERSLRAAAAAESAEPAPGGEAVPGEDPREHDARTRLRARRAAGISQEDIDY